MPTRRYKVSDKNPYKISHYKALELRYFCLQYPEWKREYKELNLSAQGINITEKVQEERKDITSIKAIKLKDLNSKIKLVEDTVHLTSPEIEQWLLKGVTTETNFQHLSLIDGIPCCEKQYYILRRKFFWLLSKER